MNGRFARSRGALDVDACEEYYDRLAADETQDRQYRLAERSQKVRRKNPQTRNRNRQMARELKHTRQNYFR
jgi:hypothetical protein